MITSSTASKIQTSLTRRLFEKAKMYHNVIDLTLGDPDYPTPENISRAGCQAIQNAQTKYTPNAGLLILREAIAKTIKADRNLVFQPEREIAVTVGAMGALYLSLKALLNKGDEVIIPEPYWVNYRQMVEMLDGVPISVRSEEADGFEMKIDKLEAALTPKTRVIIINTPNNPTGAVLSRYVLENVAQIAKKYDLVVIDDEAYSAIVFDNIPYESIITIDGMKERTILIDSFSKKYSMTGWRVGYAAADASIISCVTKFQENICSCAPMPSQIAALEALNGNQESVMEMVKSYQCRRDILFEGINQIPGLCCKKPQGTFYAFVNIKGTGMDSETFAYSLLDAVQVAVVPGITYGDAGEGFIRIACTVKEEVLQLALERIQQFINMQEARSHC